MAIIRHKVIKGERQSRTYQTFERWFREIATILQGFSYVTPNFRPFDELEVPGVSILVAGAAAAGFYPVAEYSVKKKVRSNLRKRKKGRADLWFASGTKCFSFEAKRSWDPSSHSQLNRCMEAAVADAELILDDEYNQAWGIVIAPVPETYDCAESYRKFVNADYVFEVGAEDQPTVFFFLKRAA